MPHFSLCFAGLICLETCKIFNENVNYVSMYLLVLFLKNFKDFFLTLSPININCNPQKQKLFESLVIQTVGLSGAKTFVSYWQNHQRGFCYNYLLFQLPLALAGTAVVSLNEIQRFKGELHKCPTWKSF